MRTSFRQATVEMVRLALLALLAWCVCSCSTRRMGPAWQPVANSVPDQSASDTARQTIGQAYPAAYLATQRAIITVRGRQFVCDGFLTSSPKEGWHLAVVSPLGLVTDVRVGTNGAREVLKVTPLFQGQWAREFVGEELRWLFTPPRQLVPAGYLDDGRLLMETDGLEDGLKARYACSRDGRRWEELEVLKGPRRLFHARVSSYRTFPAWPQTIPADFEIQAGSHELHVRTVAMKPPGPSAVEGVR